MEVAAPRNFYCASSALVLMLISFQCPLTKTFCLASFFFAKKINMLGKRICFKRKFLCPGTFSVSVARPWAVFLGQHFCKRNGQLGIFDEESPKTTEPFERF
jgi:hypothetical protein